MANLSNLVLGELRRAVFTRVWRIEKLICLSVNHLRSRWPRGSVQWLSINTDVQLSAVSESSPRYGGWPMARGNNWQADLYPVF